MHKKRFIIYTLLSIIILAAGFMGIKVLIDTKKILTNKLTFLSTKPLLKVKVVNFWPGVVLDDYALGIISEVLTEKYSLELVDNNYDVIIYGGPLSYKHTTIPSSEKAIKIFNTWEAVNPDIEQYDLSIGFNFIDHPKYLRIPLYYAFYRQKINENYNRGVCNPNKKYFACFLVTNSGETALDKFDGCVKRNRMFYHLSLYKKVESGGPYLNNIGKVIPRGEVETMKWLSECKFTIAYENETFDGYITEKAFQAYFGGTIPLYYAHPNVFNDINKKAVIYAGDFNSEEEMVAYIKKVDQDDKLYCDIWNQKIITNPDKNYEVIKAKLRNKLDEIFKAKFKK